MENIEQLLYLMLAGSIAYLGYRDWLYRRAFQVLGVFDMPNLKRELDSSKVALSRLEEQLDDATYNIHGMRKEIDALTKKCAQ